MKPNQLQPQPLVMINQHFAGITASHPSFSKEQPNILDDLQPSQMPAEFRTDVPVWPEERVALKKFAKWVHKGSSNRDILFILSRIALAHPELVGRQLSADARYAHAEGMELLEYWKSLMVCKQSKGGRK